MPRPEPLHPEGKDYVWYGCRVPVLGNWLVVLEADAVRDRLWQRCNEVSPVSIKILEGWSEELGLPMREIQRRAGKYSPAMSGWTYDRLRNEMCHFLDLGHTVALDGTNTVSSGLEESLEIAVKRELPIIFFKVDASREEVEDNLKKRKEEKKKGGKVNSEGWLALYDDYMNPSTSRGAELAGMGKKFEEMEAAYDGCCTYEINPRVSYFHEVVCEVGRMIMKEQHVLVMAGAPGTGKTFVLKRFIDMVKAT